MQKRKNKMKMCAVVGAVSLAALFSIFINDNVGEAKKKILPKKITASAVAMKKGEKEKISYQVKPKKTTNKKVIFSSSDKKIVTVTRSGVLQAKGEGTATITIQSKSKKQVKKKVKVTVEAPKLIKKTLPLVAPKESMPQNAVQEALDEMEALSSKTSISKITLDRNSIQLAAGESDQLIATVFPVTSTDKVMWSCDFHGGINVYQDGRIFITEDTPVGTTGIITAYSGRVSATCTIVVVQGPCQHVWGQWAVVENPECNKEGLRRSICTKCSKVREEPIEATGHSWLSKTVTDATCDEVGEREDTCQYCGEKKREVIPAKGHVWSPNGTVKTQPTCTKAGEMEYTCSVCQKTKTDPIPPNGHSWDLGEITKSPTCTATGTRTYHCTVDGCAGVKKETLEATGHTWTYGQITVQPGCTTRGTRLCTCLTCGANSSVSLDALGHTWDAGVITKNPSCTLSGVRVYTCQVCGDTKKENIAPLGHNLGDYVVDKAATCEDFGKKSRHCQRQGCTYMTDIESIKPLGHDWDAGVMTSQPDCYNTGILTCTCKRTGCGKTQRKPIAKLAHQFQVVTLRQPTCTTNGKKCEQCQLCKATKNEVLIPATGHNWKKIDADTVDPTCVKDGSAHYKCINTYTKDGKTLTCNVDKIEILNATGHNYSTTYTVDIKAGCATRGIKSKHCTNKYKDATGTLIACTSTTDEETIPPTGHKFSDWKEILKPSHGISGLEQRTCSVCSGIQERPIASEHKYNADGKCSSCAKSFTFVKSVASDWEYVLNDTDKTILLKKYIGTNTALKIPEKMDVTVDGKKASYQVVFGGHYEDRVKTSVFASNKKASIQAVTFENGVQMDNMDYMFVGCEKLEMVGNIPSTVTSMLGTFKNCINFCSVAALPAKLENISNAFEGCEKMETAPVIPDTITSMYSTFKKCTKLAAAPNLPSKLTNLDWTFSGCESLAVAPVIPNTVTSMTNTFEECKKLLEIPTSIPAGVTKLTMTFYDCDALETISKLPDTIEEMEYTFKNCDNLSYAAGLPKNLKRNVGVFEGCDKYEE
ncbi:MAG: leucine-rich repeat protein [Eubacterium sp.]